MIVDVLAVDAAVSADDDDDDVVDRLCLPDCHDIR